MIGYLFARPLEFNNGVAVLETSGLGYEVHLNEAPNFGVGCANWWIHEHAPQDAPHELYGFRDRAQRDLFRRLLDIKGVGPKVAMAVVSSGCLNDMASVPITKLCAIRGVGATLANRICEAMR